MTDKTEIEVGAIKLTGGKLLIIVPVLGTIIGGLWGGFELYQRLLDAELLLLITFPQTFLPMTKVWRCWQQGWMSRKGY